MIKSKKIDISTLDKSIHQTLKAINECKYYLHNKTVQKDNKCDAAEKSMDNLSRYLTELSSQMQSLQIKQNLGVKIIQAQEDERQRVASDIHDGPAQSMSNVVLKADVCEKMIDIDKQKAKAELKELKEIVRECLTSIRRIIYDLRPMSLDDLGLIPTLQRYLSKYTEDTNINILFKTEGYYKQELPVISFTVFRLLQEALSNVRKHSGAQNVIITLTFGEKELTLYMQDDGIGFDYEEVKRVNNEINGGFGIQTMMERIEFLGGSLDIMSKPGRGTVLNIILPLPYVKEGDDNV